MKRILAIVLMLVLMTGLFSCDIGTPKRFSAQFLQLFNTVTTIVGYTSNKKEFTDCSELVYSELNKYHQLFDIYNAYDGIANLKTINDRAGTAPVHVDQAIIDLLLFSKEMHRLTGGAVNVAFGAVLKIWHDYRTQGIEDPENAKLPPREELLAANEHTDMDQLIIDEEKQTVFFRDPLMRLDVGAIAKGYATERVSQTVREAGYTSVLISVGGNVRSIGVKPDTMKPWMVGVQDPDQANGTNLLDLRLTDLSLVTSGIYERYYTVEGKDYHHIINQETLLPAEYYKSVTILCEDSGMADALSTAVFNLPYEEGLQLIEKIGGVEAVWIFHDGTLKFSAHFQEYMQAD